MSERRNKEDAISHRSNDTNETREPSGHRGRARPGRHGPALDAQELVPPAGKGALYLRPLLLGTGPLLGLGPAPSYTFVVYGAAVGAYFKVGASALLGPGMLRCRQWRHPHLSDGQDGTELNQTLPSRVGNTM